MSKYRICPFRLTEWKVQEQVTYNEHIWLDVTEVIPMGDKEIIRSFLTEKEAEKFIDGQRLKEVLVLKIKAREERIKPREYP